MEVFSKIAAPLSSLMEKDVKFEWKNRHKQVFQELKDRLISTPVLAILRSGERFTIYSDASYQGLGCMLM